MGSHPSPKRVLGEKVTGKTVKGGMEFQRPIISDGSREVFAQTSNLSTDYWLEFQDRAPFEKLP